MKKYIFFILLLISLSANAQRFTPNKETATHVDSLQYSSSGKIIFKRTGEADLTKTELYTNAKMWFTEAFKNSSSVIQMDDPASGIIIGKGMTYIYINTGFSDVKTQMFFTIKVYTKDNKWKSEITDIYYTSIPTVSAPSVTRLAEDVISDKEVYKSNGEPRKINLSYKDNTVNESYILLQSLSERITTKTNSDW